MLPVEIWVLILSYDHVDLLNISACSKSFYQISRKNEKFVQRLNHSRLCQMQIYLINIKMPGVLLLIICPIN